MVVSDVNSSWPPTLQRTVLAKAPAFRTSDSGLMSQAAGELSGVGLVLSVYGISVSLSRGSHHSPPFKLKMADYLDRAFLPLIYALQLIFIPEITPNATSKFSGNPGTFCVAERGTKQHW